MTDMRATERLLEVIGEQTDDPKILDAKAELRRRGDTLVKARDLRLALDVADAGLLVTDREALDAALLRLDSALGGTL